MSGVQSAEGKKYKEEEEEADSECISCYIMLYTKTGKSHAVEFFALKERRLIDTRVLINFILLDF